MDSIPGPHKAAAEDAQASGTAQAAATPAHVDQYLELVRSDNAQDDARARELVQAIVADTRVRERIAELARQTLDGNAALLRHTIAQQTQALQAGPGITPREAAVYILANLPPSTALSTVRRVVKERLLILEELAPQQPVTRG